MKLMLAIFVFIFGLAFTFIVSVFILQGFLIFKVISDPTGVAQGIGNFASEIAKPVVETIRE